MGTKEVATFGGFKLFCTFIFFVVNFDRLVKRICEPWQSDFCFHEIPENTTSHMVLVKLEIKSELHQLKTRPFTTLSSVPGKKIFLLATLTTKVPVSFRAGKPV